jgi:hypothetical protein
MAKKDTMTLAGLRSTAVNIHFPVGAIRGNEGNGPADVMLIQTMFHYLARMKGGTAMRNVGFPPSQLPKIDGICGQKTKQAILIFQRFNANRLLRVDGVIEPAKYDGRNIKPGQRYMTLTWMHHLAEEMAIFNSETSYVDALISITPQLRSWLS